MAGTVDAASPSHGSNPRGSRGGQLHRSMRISSANHLECYRYGSIRPYTSRGCVRDGTHLPATPQREAARSVPRQRADLLQRSTSWRVVCPQGHTSLSEETHMGNDPKPDDPKPTPPKPGQPQPGQP